MRIDSIVREPTQPSKIALVKNLSQNPEPVRRIVTLRELAKRAGVNPSTVSRVLNRDPNLRISERSRKRILDLAASMGYRPNRLARSLKLQRTNVVGMLIPDITNPLFSALFRAIDEVAYATGYQVILCNTEDKATRLQQQLEVLSEGHVDGIVVTTAHRNDPTIEMLRQRRVPYVLVSRRRDNNEDWWIVPDDEQGAWLAVKHLAELGHRRIAHIAGSTEVSRAADRLRGYKAAMESLGLASLIWSVPFGGLDETAGETGLVQLLDYSSEQRPTAIFAANDLAAAGVIAKARQLGLQIPRDLSVIGCDDTPMSGYMAPKLTTIKYPFQDVARFAIDNLVKLILGQVGDNEAPVQLKLPVELIIRESTMTPTLRANL